MLSARRCCNNARTHLLYRPYSHATSPSKTDGLNAVIHRAEAALETDGTFPGSLAGKSIAVKDNIVAESAPTTAASKTLSSYTSPFDATVVKLLKQHGATISSKTNLDDFGMGSDSQHSHYGAVKSPYSREGMALSPGGSSGGSAVAVATGDCWAALGTDTGGSVRLPAAYTGIVGFKPSYGSLSRWGVIQYANSLDTVGVLARRVRDARDLFRVLNVYDEQDPTSLPSSLRKRMDMQSDERQRGQKLRIGVPLDYNIAELAPAVRATYTATLRALQKAGHTLQPVSLPTTRHAISAYYVLAPAEASSNLAKYDGIRYGHRTAGPDNSPAENLPLYAKTRGEAFGEEVKRRILLGAYTLSSEARDNYFVQAQKVRRLVQEDFDGVFSRRNPLLHDWTADAEGEGEAGVDVLLAPTAPTLPPTADEVKWQSPVESYMNDVFTVPASLAGLPAASVPVPLAESSRKEAGEGDVDFAGVQVIGQFGDDGSVLRVAEMVERLQG